MHRTNTSYLSALRASINDKLLQLEDQISSADPHSRPHLFEATPWPFLDDPEYLPPQPVFDLLDDLRLDLRALDSLVTPTRFKLVEIGNLPYKVAALETAVLLNVAEAIESAPFHGYAPLADLAKLWMSMSINLAASFACLPASSSSKKPSAECMGSAGGISKDITSPDTKHSFAERDAPFCKVVSKSGKTFAEYMGDPENAAMVELSGEGVVGWLNKLTRASLLGDYPWEELNEGSVIIDLGAGAGDSGMDVMRKFPNKHFKWVYQDFGPVLDMLKKSYPSELQQQVSNGDITFVLQDYFEPNVSAGNVWYARGVLHEYDDEQVLQLLGHITSAMRKTPGARMILNEVLNSSPAIIPVSAAETVPSEHIPNKQSALASTANTMTWSTFSLFGGKERSYEEYEVLLNKGGLRVNRLYKFRTFTVMMECLLQEESDA
ncbi:uncharacterized protein AB675_5495 [Cyphellophora attinorum]|uniref:O-methyltransferase C-terminal domain-containing protein n=1 Tax=Cyphellophora attinorum TaxID=1664694 RepID=A0A0N1HBS8_9EURO|nr:uncharacterized protein AB675_5495 [Phialophora attinorum]KPI41905.1 hypothetical protein AB675_5495 [Phialophora attinorum]